MLQIQYLCIDFCPTWQKSHNDVWQTKRASNTDAVKLEVRQRFLTSPR
jgi:hypothetical protein